MGFTVSTPSWTSYNAIDNKSVDMDSSAKEGAIGGNKIRAKLAAGIGKGKASHGLSKAINNLGNFKEMIFRYYSRR